MVYQFASLPPIACSLPPTRSLVFRWHPWSSAVKYSSGFEFYCTPQLIVPSTPDQSSATLVFCYWLICIAPPDFSLASAHPVPDLLLTSLVLRCQTYSSGFEFSLHSSIDSSHPPLINSQSPWYSALNWFALLPLIPVSNTKKGRKWNI